MTAPTLPGRQQMEMTDLHLAPATARLSTRGWAALRRSATVMVFVMATVAGISIGIRGVEMSPVAPTVAAAPSTVPVPVGPDTVTLGAAPPGTGQRPGGGQGGRGRGNR